MRINDLEDKILDHLQRFNEKKIADDDDEKDEENLLEFYQKCASLSGETREKMKKIDEEFEKLVLKIKQNIYSEKKWKSWTGREFRKFENSFHVFKTFFLIGFSGGF